MSEYENYPDNIVVATTRQDFYRVASKYDLSHYQTEWSRPGGALYGVRAVRIIISASVLADPPEGYDRWVEVNLMCRLAVDGELIEEGSDDAPEEETAAVDNVAV